MRWSKGEGERGGEGWETGGPGALGERVVPHCAC